jgi:hypothetical protein
VIVPDAFYVAIEQLDDAALRGRPFSSGFQVVAGFVLTAINALSILLPG